MSDILADLQRAAELMRDRHFEPYIKVVHPDEYAARAAHADGCPGQLHSALADRCTCGAR